MKLTIEVSAGQLYTLARYARHRANGSPEEAATQIVEKFLMCYLEGRVDALEDAHEEIRAATMAQRIRSSQGANEHG